MAQIIRLRLENDFAVHRLHYTRMITAPFGQISAIIRRRCVLPTY